MLTVILKIKEGTVSGDLVQNVLGSFMSRTRKMLEDKIQRLQVENDDLRDKNADLKLNKKELIDQLNLEKVKQGMVMSELKTATDEQVEAQKTIQNLEDKISNQDDLLDNL